MLSATGEEISRFGGQPWSVPFSELYTQELYTPKVWLNTAFILTTELSSGGSPVKRDRGQEYLHMELCEWPKGAVGEGFKCRRVDECEG